MDQAQHSTAVSFIWNIVADVLRDVYGPGKDHDVILPMTVIRRLDATLGPIKQAVLKLNRQPDDGGAEAFFQRDVMPRVPDAWINDAKTPIGYEISVTRRFWKPTPLHFLKEIKTDFEGLQAETEGLLNEIAGVKS